LEKVNSATIVRKFERRELSRQIRGINWDTYGRVLEIVGNIIEAHLPGVPLGTVVRIESKLKPKDILGEVVGFRENRSLIFPYESLNGTAPGARIQPERFYDRVPVFDDMLGKVFDPFMNEIGGIPVELREDKVLVPIERAAPDPMLRERIARPLSLGVRAIDGLLTVGEGQRMGIMAGSGVGKSVLMGMIARNVRADINVIGLIGERGREVREFIERDLGPEGMRRSVLVVVTGDQSPLMRVRCASVVTAVAEFFSSRGKSVLLMMDSLTRVAMAQREIGLAVGEPPTTRGYTPSVFSLIPRLLERTGPQIKGHGPISALYTVLVEGDDFNDPVTDAARSVLDGQINLSRAIAAKGHFPAIDIPTSISRVMRDIVSPQHWALANRVKELISLHEEKADLLHFGSYERGSMPLLDMAIDMMPAIQKFLRQGHDDSTGFEDTMRAMSGLFGKT
jgi:flagellum-specific ATP synthase